MHARRSVLVFSVPLFLYPGKSFLESRWAFRNQGTEPVRLGRVSVLRTDELLPDGELSCLRMLNGDTVLGGLGLDPERDYHIYELREDRFAGRVDGRAGVKKAVSPGEAVMLSVHAVEAHPQWISTDRHILQGYVDLVDRPVWHPSTRTLRATSNVVGKEPYHVVIALNGYTPVVSQAENAQATIVVRADNSNLADLCIERQTSGRVPWTVTFDK